MDAAGQERAQRPDRKGRVTFQIGRWMKCRVSARESCSRPGMALEGSTAHAAAAFISWVAVTLLSWTANTPNSRFWSRSIKCYFRW